MKRQGHLPGSRRAGFTLLELLVSSVMVAVLVSSLYGIFRGAHNMQKTTTDMLEAGRPLADLERPFRIDIEDCLAPVGLLAGPLLGEKNEQSGARHDTLELYTTSARVIDSSPWGEICKVDYALEQMESTANQDAGLTLVRTVTRNLLASSDSTPVAITLIEGVQSLAFAYYDGETWQDSWDATSVSSVMPTAIRVDIAFVPPRAGERLRPPLSWVFEVPARPASTSTAQSGGAQAGGGGAP